MHAFLIGHAIGSDGVIEACHQRVTRDADIHGNRLGPFEQPVEMGVEKSDPALVHPQSFPDPVAKHETAVENRNHSLGARGHHSVDVDQYICVARIGGKIMRAFGHGIEPSDLWKASGELYELYSVKEKKRTARKKALFRGWKEVGDKIAHGAEASANGGV